MIEYNNFMNTIYVSKTVKFEEEPSELDFDNREQFGWEDHDKHDFVEISNSMISTDAEPIAIDQMIEILNKAKAAGSTHVAVEYHCDHIGYEITGFEMRLSTAEEIADYEARKKVEQEKRKRIHELQSEISKLRNS